MKPRERVFAALQRQEPDRVPRFEIWIDALLDELGQHDPASAYVNLGQDCVMMPTLNLLHPALPPLDCRRAGRAGRVAQRWQRRTAVADGD